MQQIGRFQRIRRGGWAAGLALLLAPVALEAQAATAGDSTWAPVERALGRHGTMQPGDVYKFSLPRSDLVVRVGGVRVRPALALGSWVAFRRMGDSAMAMGDLVLTEAEVGPVMAKLQAMGVSQTAVHHHILHETPRVTYMHIAATGDPVRIAEAIRAAVALTKTPSAARSPAASSAFALDTARIATTLGHAGKVNGGVYQVSIPRADTIREGGMDVPPAMGVASAINFQPTGGGKAAITGDFVLTADEVNPVIQALRGAGIGVTALHNHMLRDEPRLFFSHFWANDDSGKLAQGLRLALDRTNSLKSGT